MSVKVTKKAAADSSEQTLLEKAAEPIKGIPDAEVLTDQLVKLSAGTAFAPVIKDHMTAITNSLARGDAPGAARLMQRGLATLDSYTAAVNKLEAAAALFTASADKYADAYERIIAVLQERASVLPIDTTTEAYKRIDAIETEIARMKSQPFDIGEAN